MSVDLPLTVAAFGIGIVVGLTGMGGGGLMTPVLVLFFGVERLTAVSSDLVASAVMMPVGSMVHLCRGTVHLGLVRDATDEETRAGGPIDAGANVDPSLLRPV